MASSQILKFEVENTPDVLRRERLRILKKIAKKTIKITKEIEKRAKCFETSGTQSFNALHLACAEMEADILFTVDRRFLKKAKEVKDLKMKVRNPLEWIEEVYNGKNN